jgi:L-lactate dehydrogenase complex protein LldG
MIAEAVTAFESSLDRLDVGWTRTDLAAFNETLEAVITEPAVGAHLPYDTVSLSEAPVTLDPTSADLDAAATGITAAAFAIAEYGSIVIHSNPVSLYPYRHVAVLRERDIVLDMSETFVRLGSELRETRGSAIIATGPSATADMGSLVRGAHGPTEIHVVIVETTQDRPMED